MTNSDIISIITPTEAGTSSNEMLSNTAKGKGKEKKPLISATIDDLSLSSQQVWAKLDPTFAQIKKTEDKFRTIYALPPNDKRRPDLKNPLWGLIHIDQKKLTLLRKTMRQAYLTNLTRRADNYIMVGGANRFHSFRQEQSQHHILNLLEKLPPKLRKHVCLAGGALIDMISLESSHRTTDYDLFLVGTDQPEQILTQLLTIWQDFIREATRTKHAVTCKLCGFNVPAPIQIILRSYVSPSEVVIGFDLDPSGICWYEGKLYTTHRAFRSLMDMTIRLDIDRMSTSYNYRLIKYSKRKGFAIRVPYTISDKMRAAALKHIDQIYANWRKIDLATTYNNSLLGLLVAQTIMSANGHMARMERSDYDEGPEPSKYYPLPDTIRQYFRKRRMHLQMGKDCNCYGYSCVRYDILDDAFINEPINIIDIKTFPPVHMIKGIKWSFPLKVEFIERNPGSQFTGSFHPLTMTSKKWCQIFPPPPQCKLPPPVEKKSPYYMENYLNCLATPLLPVVKKEATSSNYIHISPVPNYGQIPVTFGTFDVVAQEGSTVDFGNGVVTENTAIIFNPPLPLSPILGEENKPDGEENSGPEFDTPEGDGEAD